MKSILGAAVIGADIIFGMAAPAVIANFHKEAHSHQFGTIGFYVLLTLLTLWVIMSAAGTASAGKKPPARSGYTSGGPR